MLVSQIDEDLKSAQKEKNEVAVSSLRNLKAALKNAEIAAREGRASTIEDGREKQHQLSDDEAASVITKKVKQHKDSIESFKAGGREDLVANETSQMAVLQKYLPEAMSEDKLTAIVKEVIAESQAGAKDFGKVMKDVMAKVKGQADGTIISKIVKEQLK